VKGIAPQDSLVSEWCIPTVRPNEPTFLFEFLETTVWLKPF
jgi:hypothetical protein